MSTSYRTHTLDFQHLNLVSSVSAPSSNEDVVAFVGLVFAKYLGCRRIAVATRAAAASSRTLWRCSTDIVVSEHASVQEIKQQLQPRALGLTASECTHVPLCVFEVDAADLVGAASDIQHDHGESEFFLVELAITNHSTTDTTPTMISGRMHLTPSIPNSLLAANRVVRHWEALWRQYRGDLTLAELSLLHAEDLEFLEQYNATSSVVLPSSASSTSDSRRLDELFLVRARALPTSIALFDSESPPTRTTYAELEAASSRVQQTLLTRYTSHAPCETVALLFARSIDVVIAMLGVLRSGASYLVIEPSLPSARIQLMLDAARCDLVLLPSRQAASRFLDDTDDSSILATRSLLYLDQVLSDDVAPQPQPRPQAASSTAAHVMFTSGSTGVPKGIVTSHVAIVNRIEWMWRQFPFRADEVMCFKTALAFVDSVWELYGPLLYGIPTLVLADLDAKDPDRLLAQLARHSITRLVLVPSLLTILLEAMPDIAQRVPKLWLWTCSGEPLLQSTVDQFHRLLPGRVLLNLYGSTEVAGDATFHVLPLPAEPAAQSPSAAAESRGVPIGTPLSNTQIAIVQREYGYELPPGLVGEICVGGVQVLERYLVETDNATALCTLAPPIGTAERRRLYRTGDLGFISPDSRLLYYGGRIDRQIKIRGIRVQPAEIESALLELSGVRAAVVMLRDGDRHQLQAVLEADPLVLAPPLELSRLLRLRLPDYLVPSHFAVLTEMPRTPTGKIDRRALELLTATSNHSRDLLLPNNISSRADAVAALQSIVCHTLAVDESTLLAHEGRFVELGGNSLLAMRLVSLVRQRYGITLSLSSILSNLPVDELAEALFAAVSTASRQSVPQEDADELGALERCLHQHHEHTDDESSTGFPLTFAQQSLWILAQLNPTSTEYSLPFCIRVRGISDPTVIRNAITRLYALHAALRIRLRPSVADEREVVQVVGAPDEPVSIESFDLRNEQAEGHDAEAQLLSLQSAMPFDLRTSASQSLSRFAIIRTAELKWTIFINLHHIISDGVSIAVVVHDLRALLLSNVALPPSEPQLAYLRFAQWERALDPHRQSCQTHTRYWLQYLDGLPTVLLPTDSPRTPNLSRAGRVSCFPISHELSRRIEALRNESHVTSFSLLLAAFQLLLAHFTAAEHVVLGVPVANRPAVPSLERTVGLFVNSVVVRADVPKDITFLQLVAQAQSATASALEHQELPFASLVQLLRPDRNVSLHPLFQVMFSIEYVDHQHDDEPVDDSPFATPHVSSHQELDTRCSPFEMHFLVQLDPAGRPIQIVVQYSTALFRERTISRMASHWLALLDAVLDRPRSPVSSVHIASNAYPPAPASPDRPSTQLANSHSVFDYFARLARQDPDLLAIVQSGHKSVTYRELALRAHSIARLLHRHNISAPARIGISMRRSIDAIAAILGILKHGSSYVPLDPEFPLDRLAFMISQAHVQAVMVDDSNIGFVDKIMAHHHQHHDDDDHHSDSQSTSTIEINLSNRNNDNDNDEEEEEGDEEIASINGSEECYVLFTSGSTGRPKGVAVSHSNVIGLVQEAGFVEVRRGDRVGQLNTFNFDLAAYELFVALTNGGTLCLIDNQIKLNPSQLATAVRDLQPTVLLLPTALFNVIAAVQPDAFRGVQWLQFAGEKANQKAVERVMYASAPRFIQNLYGPTECTVFCTCYDITASDMQRTIPIPIGRAVPQALLYVVDPHMRLVPIGVPGELLIGGTGVAIGYVNQPDLTRERFIINPFGDGRVYKSGDIVRWIEIEEQENDTRIELEYLHRRDTQVKVRGHRVELGEIEQVICKHARVREAVVMLHSIALPCRRSSRDRGNVRAELEDHGDHEIGDGEEERGSSIEELVGYVVMEGGEGEWRDKRNREEEEERIKRHVSELVPRWMVPRWIMIMEEGRFPINRTGKIDKSKLPSPSPKANQQGSDIKRSPTATATTHSSPTERMQAKLCELFAECLNLDAQHVSPSDSFFELGGHSLRAIRLVALINTNFPVEVAFASVFQFPTPAALAALIESSVAAAHESDVTSSITSLTARRTEPGDALPLSFTQEQLWFLQAAAPDSAFYTIPYAFELFGDLDQEAFEQALAALYAMHEALCVVFEHDDLSQPAASDPLLSTSGIVQRKVWPSVAFSRAFSSQELWLPAGCSESEAAAILERTLCAEAVIPIDLASGTSRLRLYSIRELPTEQSSCTVASDMPPTRRFAFLALFHHMNADGWSVAMFFRQLVQHYNDIVADIGAAAYSTAAPTLQFSDVARWQRESAAQGAHAGSLRYWIEALSPLPPPLTLPFPSKRRPMAITNRGAAMDFALPQSLARTVLEQSRAIGATPFVVLLAAWQLTLSLLSDQKRFVLGCPFAARSPVLEGVFGCLMKTLPLLADLSECRTFGQLVNRVQASIYQAMEHQEAPFDAIVAAVDPAREPTLHPLFQIVFAYQAELPETATAWAAGLQQRSVRLDHLPWSKFDLSLEVWRCSEDGISCSCSFNTDQYFGHDVLALLHCWRSVLEQVTLNFACEIEQVALLAPHEQHAMLEQTRPPTHPNRTRTTGSLVALFEAHAREYPLAIAVESGRLTITYRELALRAHSIARLLHRHNISAPARIGISMRRSIDAIAAILGILKHGSSYVPLDPEFPLDRLAFMISQAHVQAVMVDDSNIGFVDKIMAHHHQHHDDDDHHSDSQSTSTIEINLSNRDNDEEEEEGDEEIASINGSEECYVLFTSGSTGRPKGVAVSHSNVIGLVQEAGFVEVRRGDRVGQLNTFNFDPSVFEIFVALTNGGTLVILSEDVQRVYDTQLPRLHLVACSTAWFHALVHTAPQALQRLEVLAFGGEPLGRHQAARMLQFSPETAGFNLYGPTECTFASTFHRLVPGDFSRDISIPIGRAVPQALLYVVDPHMRLVPIGVPGELLIGGTGVAIGYVNQPDLTRERFITNPFGDGRVYKSGDIVRWIEIEEQENDTRIELEYLHRRDTQVKVRGHRVELGEIEQVICKHARVREAVVMLHSIALPCRRSSRDRGNVRAELEDDGDHEIGDGEEERGSSIEELVGYVVMEGGEGEWRDKRNRQEEEERIKRHVSELVPRWMVPRWIMIMEEGRFPINRTGKIDKSKLPIPRLDDSYHASAEFPLSTGSDLGRQRLGPSQLPFSGSSVKATIQRVWFELTGTRPHDEQRFFEAGGNSIMLLKLHQRLQREFACVVSVADLLRHVTVEAQTSLIERQLAQQHSRALQPGIARAPDLAVPAPSISRHTAVAVIGLACRVPSCDSASEFWQALLEGRDCITRWTAEEMMAFGVLASVVQRANYVRANGVLQQAEWFDASFFELNANEAALIDPQHRMLLECSHDALREGGLVPRAFDGRIGCFLSTAKSTWDSYVGARLAGDGKLHEGDSAAASAFLVERGNLADAAPCLVAYKLGLQGPAVAVQMACASSLAAVHLACRAIANGDCTAALAGGCSVQFPQHQGYVHSPGMILSADGRCRSFDAQASGLVSGDGVGVVVLMELEEAQRHGYPIQAVIRGSFIVNDGSDKLSFSASNPDAQALAIRSALAQAQLQPHDIDVIEAHGSGTQLGDLQEYQALHQVFSGSEAGSWRRSRDTTWLGSVKSNVGHLGPAAGIAGLIKTILAMRRGVVPATVHFQQLHPSMQGLGASRLRVSSSAQAWDHREGSSSARGRSDPTRKALVHSLGQGGNNVSVVIEEYRERQPAARHSHSDLASMADRLRRSGGGGSVAAAAGESFCQDQAVLLVTAHTRVALLELCSALLQSVHEIGEHVTSPLAQDEHLWALCHSLYCASSNATLGRRYRAAIVCRASSSSAARALARTVASQREDEAVLASERPLSLSDSSPFAYVDSEQAVFERPDVAFVFAGQGGIAQGTGVFLYSHSSIFAHSFDSCAVAMFEHTGLDARKLLFGGGESLSASQSRASETIIECESSHVVGFALAVATIEWLRSVGIRAAIVAGHSLGEVAAAYACGALSLGQATAIVVARAKALSRIESGLGGMLWLQAGENQAQCLIDSDPSTASSLNVAGANAPLSTVVSGPLDAIAALEHRCREAGIATKRIKVSHAFHSPMVESVLASFESSVAAILSAGEHSSAPGRAVAGGTHDGGTYLSCVTGEPLGDFTAVLRSASYWRQHMRQTVRFSDACRQLYERANNRRVVVVEIGASRVLSSLVRENRPHLGDAGSIVREDREREVVILGSLLRDGTSALQVLEFLGQAWAHGIDVAWERVFDWSACKRAPLPAYPYQRVPCSPLELDFDYHSNSAAMAMKIESSCERVVELSCVTTARGTMIQQVPHDGTAPLDESLFAVGCVSGLLTVALLARLMKLYPGGALQLEATLASLLPASMCGKVAGRIRLVHLASHTSGLLCFPHDLAERENADLPLQQQLMAFDEQRLSEYLQRGCRLEFEPGEQCLYSNFGIAILAHVISHVMQRSYLELLEELLLLPLGIGQVCIGPQARGDNKSFASTLDRAGGRVEPWQCGPIFGAADGVYMTPRQCLRFSEILARPASAIEREVSCGVRRFMLRNREAPAASEQYEWYMGRTQASCIWIGVDATRGVGAVVMSNADMEAPALLAAGDRLLSSQRGMAARSLTREVLLLWAGQSVDRGAMNHQIDATPNQMPLEATIDSKQPATTRETATESVPRTSKLDVRDAVVACIARVIRVEVATFEQSLLAASFKELGIDSLQLIILSDSLSVALAQPVPLVALYEHATPQALIVYLQQRGQDASLLGSSTPAQEPKRTFSSHEGSAPAVIACTMATRGSGGSTLMAGALRSFEVEEQQALARAAEAVAAWHTAVGQGAVVRLAHDVRSSTVPLPVVASPASVRVASVAQLCARIEDSRSELRTMLAHAGALLFRGYHVHGAEDFSAVVSALAGSSAALREYRDGISPRTVVLDRVYTSTEYPACYDMALHNEMSYSREPPSCIAFCCVVAPEYGSGGQTPLVDSRRVLRRLDPEVVRTFRQQSLLYQVNYPSRGMGPGVSWQTAFDTEEAALVERYCRELGAEFEWLPYESLELQQEASSSSTSAPAQRLRTYKVGPTIRVHPVTQQEVWSNHAHLFHPSDLPTPTLEALQRTYGNDTSSLPKNCTFADPEHTPLASDQLAHIRHTLWTESVSFDWMAGDILVVDNLAVAHGRRAFVGERLILAAMF